MVALSLTPSFVGHVVALAAGGPPPPSLPSTTVLAYSHTGTNARARRLACGWTGTLLQPPFLPTPGVPRIGSSALLLLFRHLPPRIKKKVTGRTQKPYQERKKERKKEKKKGSPYCSNLAFIYLTFHFPSSRDDRHGGRSLSLEAFLLHVYLNSPGSICNLCILPKKKVCCKKQEPKAQSQLGGSNPGTVGWL